MLISKKKVLSLEHINFKNLTIMKKLFLFAVLALFSFMNINAQGESESNDGSPYGWSKGDVYLSGAVGIWSTKMGDSKENQFTAMPQGGFLVTDHIAVGAQFGYMSSKSEVNNNVTSETNTFMAGAYGKWLCSPETQFTPYLGVGFNYLNEKEKVSDITYDGFEFGAGAGLLFSLNEHFVIGANYAIASYSTLKSNVDGAESRNTFTAGLDWKQLDFSLGYRF